MSTWTKLVVAMYRCYRYLVCRRRVSRAASQLLASGTARVASSQYRSVTEKSSASEDLINMSIKVNEPGATGQPEGHAICRK